VQHSEEIYVNYIKISEWIWHRNEKDLFGIAPEGKYCYRTGNTPGGQVAIPLR
jgi:hypothetical protein